MSGPIVLKRIQGLSATIMILMNRRFDHDNNLSVKFGVVPASDRRSCNSSRWPNLVDPGANTQSDPQARH